MRGSLRPTGRIAAAITMLVGGMAQLSAAVISGPTVTLNPNGTTPLAAVLEVETDTPAQLEIRIQYGGETTTVLFPDVTTQHSVPILGLKPDRTYGVTPKLIPGGILSTQLVTTAPLPADFPSINVVTNDTLQMEPGYTLLDCFLRGPDPRPRWGVIIDHLGEVVWYTDECWNGMRQLPNGQLLARVNQDMLRMDLLGNIEVVPLQDPGTGLHHDLEPTPHGTFLSLSKAPVEVEDFPTSETDPNAPTQTTTVRDEPVVEFFADGTVRRQWSLIEMLDDTRIAYDSLLPTSDGVDWIHTNAVTYNPADDSIVVSGRHQDAVIKFSRQSGALQWVLGNHENWPAGFQGSLLSPIGAPFEWQYHQHAPMWTGSNTLLLFDNGNYRASPFDGTTPLADENNYSRGVEFTVDESNMTVEQLWEYGASASPRLYSFFISDADWMPQTNNRLIDYGGIIFVDGVASADIGRGTSYTRIIEVTDETPAVKVFDVEYYDPTGGRVNTYRVERIPSLYPPETIKAPNGVGNTLFLDRVAGDTRLEWSPAPIDAGHSAAEHYRIYASSVPDSGFAITESIAALDLLTDDPASPLVFYKIVAGNVSGTSNDLPPTGP